MPGYCWGIMSSFLPSVWDSLNLSASRGGRLEPLLGQHGLLFSSPPPLSRCRSQKPALINFLHFDLTLGVESVSQGTCHSIPETSGRSRVAPGFRPAPLPKILRRDSSFSNFRAKGVSGIAPGEQWEVKPTVALGTLHSSLTLHLPCGGCLYIYTHWAALQDRKLAHLALSGKTNLWGNE